MRTDIALSQRAIDGVRQRVKRDIRVRMANKAVVMGNFDTAKDDPITRPEFMYVEPVTDPNIHVNSLCRRRDQRRFPDMVFV